MSDGSKAYKAAIYARLGHARHVLDRFHVIRWFAAGLTAVRRPEGSKPAFDPQVFRARFVLMRRPDTLDTAGCGRLEGANGLLQVLRRRADGFTDHADFEARGILIA